MHRSPLLVVYLTVFLDLLGFGIILPLLPFYAQSFGASGVWVGALFTAYSGAQIAGAAIMGRLSDRVGRRPVLLLSLLGSALSLALTGLADSLVLLLVGRALAGLFGGSIAAAQAYIADVTRPEQRAKYMGLLGAAIGMGFVLGPGIGAALSRFGFGAAAFAAAGLAAANLVFALFRLPESRRPGPAARQRAPLTPAALRAALRHPIIGRLLAATFLTTLGFVTLEATAALFGERRFGLDAEKLGYGFLLLGLVVAAAQAGVVGRLAARHGERALATGGAALLGLALLAVPAVTGLGLAAVVGGFLALGYGVASPALSALLSREASADEQGGTLGMGQSISALARAVGPLAAGWLFDQAAALPFVAAAAAALAAAWTLSRPTAASRRAPLPEVARVD